MKYFMQPGIFTPGLQHSHFIPSVGINIFKITDSINNPAYIKNEYKQGNKTLSHIP